jgi:hypothetical protein
MDVADEDGIGGHVVFSRGTDSRRNILTQNPSHARQNVDTVIYERKCHRVNVCPSPRVL